MSHLGPEFYTNLQLQQLQLRDNAIPQWTTFLLFLHVKEPDWIAAADFFATLQEEKRKQLSPNIREAPPYQALNAAAILIDRLACSLDPETSEEIWKQFAPLLSDKELIDFPFLQATVSSARLYTTYIQTKGQERTMDRGDFRFAQQTIRQHIESISSILETSRAHRTYTDHLLTTLAPIHAFCSS